MRNETTFRKWLMEEVEIRPAKKGETTFHDEQFTTWNINTSCEYSILRITEIIESQPSFDEWNW